MYADALCACVGCCTVAYCTLLLLLLVVLGTTTTPSTALTPAEVIEDVVPATPWLADEIVTTELVV